MQYWLLKTEPETFSWADLVACGDQGEPWDGVRNHQAAGYLRAMENGDRGLIYHSGKARAVVGMCEIISTAYPDPTDAQGRFVAVTVAARAALAHPLSLSQIKANAEFSDFALVRHSRLSVMPVNQHHWRLILSMAHD